MNQNEITIRSIKESKLLICSIRLEKIKDIGYKMGKRILRRNFLKIPI